MAFLFCAELGKTVLGKPALGVYMYVLYRTVQYHKLTLTLWVGGRGTYYVNTGSATPSQAVWAIYTICSVYEAPAARGM